jgi:Polysaccharide lyase
LGRAVDSGYMRGRRRLYQGLVIGALATVSVATAGSGPRAGGGQRPPVNSTLPSISGAAVEGQSVTADPGRWTGPARTYSFQWRRCDSSGAACSAIAAATRKSYLVVAADVGKTLRVTVVASNKNGSATATSGASAVVTTRITATTSTSTATTTTSSVPPSNTAPPTISGTPQQGQTLTAAPGSWSGTAPFRYAYQWKRCDAAGASCAAISGATSTAYLLTSAEVSSTIRVSVTASNSVGSATASSAATATVGSPPAPSGTPPSGRVLYRKTGEGTANVIGTNSLEEPCYPNLPDIYGQSFCRWNEIAVDATLCGPFKDPNDRFAGVNSIRFDIRNTPNTTQRCEIGKHRLVDAYTHDWYHTAFKFEPTWAETSSGGAVVHQLNYQSICAAPLFLSVDDSNDSAYLIVNAGPDDWNGYNISCKYYSGQPGWASRPVGAFPGTPLYVIPPGQFTKGTWHEVLFHVYWTPINEGILEAWYRPKGGTWVKNLDIGPVGSGRPLEYNFPTLATGNQIVPQGCTEVTVENINDPCHWPSMDKMGQYHSNNTSSDGIPTMWGEFCRASSREAAETCLG